MLVHIWETRTAPESNVDARGAKRRKTTTHLVEIAHRRFLMVVRFHRRGTAR